MKAGKSQDNKSPNNLCSSTTPKVCLLKFLCIKVLLKWKIVL